jgi:parallel beta-helix repeat protein
MCAGTWLHSARSPVELFHKLPIDIKELVRFRICRIAMISDKILLSATFVLLLTLLLPLSLSFNARAETSLPVLNVNTGLAYATIQEAINAPATLNGHTIRVNVGTYYENVAVNKSVALVGDNKFSTVIDGGGSKSVINVTADNASVTGFTVRNSQYGYAGVHVYQSKSDNVSGNIVEDNYNGIYLYGSSDDTVEGNEALNNQYGIHLYGSSNVTLSNNVESNNTNDIHLDVSSNNTLVDNEVSSSITNGIYLYGSNYNTLSNNDVFSNPGRGIRLQYSFNNTLSGNTVSNDGNGIDFYGSDGNVISGNTVSLNNQSGILLFGSSESTIDGNSILNNTFGVWFVNSNGSTISGNNISSNSQYGARLWNSSSNTFFRNNFVDNLVKNVEQPTNTSLLNLWDNGAEGNFWGDNDAAGVNVEGIGSEPYVVDQNALGVYGQDMHPLMGEYLQFTAAFENRSYTVAVVSNSSARAISGFQYHQGKDNSTNAISFQLGGGNGNGFCRLCIPQVLVAYPYVVTADGAPLSYTLVMTNGTHTWVYFAYPSSTNELIIAPVMTPEVPVWSFWWFWGISALALVGVVFGGFTVKYRRKVSEQTRILQAYSPFMVAEALFTADIERRGMKIKEFEEKYGVKIEPRSTLEEVLRSMEKKQEEES